MNISAYIPCYNNERTLAQAIASLRQQSAPVAELFVVDDGSTDGSHRVAEGLGVRVIRHEQNLGRGAARARAMTEARHELVLCCDANNCLSPEFSSRALTWFHEPKVAAVVGRMVSPNNRTARARWRARHLFKVHQPCPVNRRASLSTGGLMARKASVIGVGNFNPELRHSEDADLGERLLAAGYEVVFDPQLEIIAVADNTLGQLLERYWRWYAGANEAVSVKAYLRQTVYSIKVMAREDLRQHDPMGVPISLLSPHYQFWRSARNRILRRR